MHKPSFIRRSLIAAAATVGIVLGSVLPAQAVTSPVYSTAVAGGNFVAFTVHYTKSGTTRSIYGVTYTGKLEQRNGFACFRGKTGSPTFCPAWNTLGYKSTGTIRVETAGTTVSVQPYLSGSPYTSGPAKSVALP